LFIGGGRLEVFCRDDDAKELEDAFCWSSFTSSFTSLLSPSSFGIRGGFPGGGLLVLGNKGAIGNIFLSFPNNAFGAAAIRSLCDTNTAHVVDTNATAGRIGGTPLDERDIMSKERLCFRRTQKEEAIFCGYF
jgi:hypothetical protein